VRLGGNATKQHTTDARGKVIRHNLGDVHHKGQSMKNFLIGSFWIGLLSWLCYMQGWIPDSVLETVGLKEPPAAKKKMYTWRDEKGRIVYSDTLPPDKQKREIKLHTLDDVVTDINNKEGDPKQQQKRPSHW
jgi:hypothetical protein